MSNADTLYNVISKLYAVADFFQMDNEPQCVIHKRTPEGLYLIMTECIDTLKEVGGLNERQTN